MPLKILPERNKDWSLFPATKTVAYYATEANYIELSEVSSSDLASALGQTDPCSSYDVLPLLLHELRHWFDHTATLWGRQRLASLFEALSARYQNDEYEFWRIMSYRRRVREDVRGEYFSTIGDKTSTPTQPGPWKAETTMGVGFDRDGRPDESAPIAFSRFTWPDGELACRVPLSVSALLETNAMCFELLAAFSLMQQLPEDQRRVEEVIAGKKWFAQLYDPELGVYSVAVHMVANNLGMKDAINAYRYSAALASIALNIPTSLFDSMNVPPAFLTPWGERNRACLKQRSRSYAYLVLLEHSAPYVEGQDISEWLEATLINAGLPGLLEFETQTRAEMKAIGENAVLADPYQDRFRLLEQVGDENFDRLGVHPTLDVVLAQMKNLNFCPIVTEDLEWSFLGKQNNLQSEGRAEQWYETVSNLLGLFTEFTDACS